MGASAGKAAITPRRGREILEARAAREQGERRLGARERGEGDGDEISGVRKRTRV
jgi:hypothetical protein